MLFIDNIDNTPATVTLTIPIVREADGSALTLEVVHSVSLETHTYTFPTYMAARYKAIVSLTLEEAIPTGQYTYTLTDGTGELSAGLLQVGTAEDNTPAYAANNTTKVYEG